MVDHPHRTVFFVSESTGITAETMGHSLLSQFPHLEFTYLQRPYVDSEKKAESWLTKSPQLIKSKGSNR